VSKQPTIADARALAMKYRKPGVAIFHVGREGFGFASFGMTRRQCDALGVFADEVFDLVQDGTVDLSAFTELKAPGAQQRGGVAGELEEARGLLRRALDHLRARAAIEGVPAGAPLIGAITAFLERTSP
jgi:hypothetical protein